MTRLSLGHHESATERGHREKREREQVAAFPDVEYVWTATSRVARLKDTGIQIWQVVRAFRDLEGDRAGLRAAFDVLTPAQVERALGFYAAYPAEIDARILADDEWTEKRVAALNERLTKSRA